jgi:hypothetical protein
MTQLTALWLLALAPVHADTSRVNTSTTLSSSAVRVAAALSMRGSNSRRRVQLRALINIHIGLFVCALAVRSDSPLVKLHRKTGCNRQLAQIRIEAGKHTHRISIEKELHVIQAAVANRKARVDVVVLTCLKGQERLQVHTFIQLFFWSSVTSGRCFHQGLLYQNNAASYLRF